MDLEARVRSFFAAVAANEPGAIMAHMAPGVSYQVEGKRALGHDALAEQVRKACAQLAAVEAEVLDVAVKRNVTFVQWRSRGTLRDGRAFTNRGVHILSWDQDGRIAHATVHEGEPNFS